MLARTLLIVLITLGCRPAPAEAAGSLKSEIPNPESSRKETQTLLMKVTEIVGSKKKPETILKLRFDCEPTRYTAWIVAKDGVLGGDSEIQLNKTIKWKLKAEKRGPRVLAIEDSKGESEKTFFDRLKDISFITVEFQNGKGKPSKASFVVRGIHEQIKEAEGLCFKD